MTEPSDTDRDALVREVLAGRSDSGRAPREATFYFYGEKFDELAKAAARAGYLVQPTNWRPGVVLETVTAVDEERFERHARQMQAWAEEFDCEYDGWECRLVTQ